MAESDYVMVGYAGDEIGSKYGSDSYDPDGNWLSDPDAGLGSTPPHTGSWRWPFSGRTRGVGFFTHHDFAPLTTRIGFWMYYWGVWNDNSEIGLAQFRVLDSGLYTQVINVVFDCAKRHLRFDVYNTFSETWSTVGYSFNILAVVGSPYAWKHIGCLFNWDGQWFSLYANGRKIVTWSLASIIEVGYPYAMSSDFVGSYVDIDDVYLEHSPYSEDDVAPPARRFYPALPNGVGDVSQWTPSPAVDNYLNVDEATAPDDATTTVSASSDGIQDLYQFADVTLPVNETPTAALLQAYLRTLAGRGNGFSWLKFLYQGTGALGEGTTKLVKYPVDENALWTTLFDRFPLTPEAGPWTESEFNGGQFGYELVDQAV